MLKIDVKRIESEDLTELSDESLGRPVDEIQVRRNSTSVAPAD
jgi:hypothetical protein